MLQSLRNIAIIIEELGVDTPAQQLLDRFLIGYPLDGEFHRVADCQLHVWLAPGENDSELQRRLTDFPLRRHQSIDTAAAAADGIVLVPKDVAAPQLLE